MTKRKKKPSRSADNETSHEIDQNVRVGRVVGSVVGTAIGFPLFLIFGLALLVQSSGANRPRPTQASVNRERTVAVVQASTNVSTSTNQPTVTFTPSKTPSKAATATKRPTLKPTDVPTQTLYATGNANLRPCTKTTSACAPAGAVSGGQELTVLGQEQGDTVSGSDIWYKVLHNGQELYIHSSLVSATRPVVQPTRSQQQSNASGGAGNQSSSPANTPIVASTPAQQVISWNCSGNIYNCDSFANRSELLDYFRTCPNDPSRLDGDDDGIPCE